MLPAHTCRAEHLPRAAAANESKPLGNSRGHFKSGIFRLDKGLKFSYIPALPSCFNCMNEGHLKWFGFETKEELWGMNPKQRDQIQCLFISLLASRLPLSPKPFCFLLLLSWCLTIAVRLNKTLTSCKKKKKRLVKVSFLPPGGLSTSSLNSFFCFFYAWNTSCDFNAAPAKINFSIDGWEIVEMEQPAGFFHLFGDLGTSWIVALCLFL